MTYICTLAIHGIDRLVRIDAEHSLLGVNAHYRVTRRDGSEQEYTQLLGPDTYGVGVNAMSIVSLVRDLNFSEVEGLVSVVHAGTLDAEGLEEILAGVRPAYEIRNLAASATVN